MHVLLLGSFSQSLTNFRGPLIRDLLAAGVKVSVGAPEIDAKQRAVLEGMGAQVHETEMQRTGLNPLADIAYFKRLKRLMQDIKPDKVLTYTIKPNIWGSFAAAACGASSYAMVTGLGGLFTDVEKSGAMKRRVLAKVASTLYARSTARNYRVIFQNPDDLKDFVSAGCLADPEKARIVHGSGVDMAHYARATLPKVPSFLMISRLLKSKGVREFGEAAVLIKSRHPNVRVRLVGYFDEGSDGVDPQDVERWQAQGMEYSGPMDDVRSAIEQAAVYVLPSYREGTPRSVLEAMAMGRAIITSHAPGCRETVEDGKTGMLVPLQDPRAVAAAMEKFIVEPSLIDQMGEASYQLAARKYEVGAVNKSVMQILELSEGA